MRFLRTLQFICLIAALCGSRTAMAQFVEISTNGQPSAPAKPDTVAVPAIDPELLYKGNPDLYYPVYRDSLIAQKKYKVAEKLVNDRLKQSKDSPEPSLFIDLGRVYFLQDKKPKAEEQFEKALRLVNGDDARTQKLVKAFLAVNRPDWAVKAYEQGGELMGNSFLHYHQLADLYVKTGQTSKAVLYLLSGPATISGNPETMKTELLHIIGSDPEKLREAQKVIIGRINEQPDNAFLADVLTWIYTQKGDWDGALLQVEAIDELAKEGGRRLLEFAGYARSAGQFDAADKALDDIVAKGADLPYYATAKSERLTTDLARLRTEPNPSPQETDSLAARYDAYEATYPMAYGYQIAADHAEVLSHYAGDPEAAARVLKGAVARPDFRRDQVGTLKLQLGDCYLMMGRIWEASLIYSQVDKDFKQDAMGEDARFRNAKLAYYRGDFDWAQRQLLILKSATSELIANDALALSVLITENVEDSDRYPLQRFAYADLLVAQNKSAQATQLLDSIAKAFPKHPLNDDILMLRAKMAEQHHDFKTALAFLDKIHDKYGTDVLADDAVFKMAEIYRDDLNDPVNAKKYYEQLIIEYPGSTFAQTARTRLYEIDHPATP
jgi:tetratricopeptide (TPR) repeat protein